MADPFLGELRLVPYNFNPSGWQFAYGQIVPISQFSALFSLLGTYFGGNGTSNFGLPNLQGNVAVGVGQGPGLSLYELGQTGGVPFVTLILNEIPAHSHTPMGTSARASQTTPGGNTLAEPATSVGNLYSTTATNLQQMATSCCVPVGGGLPHNNMAPFLGLNWIIAFQGIYPQRS